MSRFQGLDGKKSQEIFWCESTGLCTEKPTKKLSGSEGFVDRR